MDARFWMLVGEARSKCMHLAGAPLNPAAARKLYRIYLAKGAQATTSIEGNTLTEREVKARIRGERTLPESREYLGREVDNIVEACQKITDALLARSKPSLDAAAINAFNAQVLKNLDVGEDVFPGVPRQYSVGVSGYRGAPHEDVPYLLDELCKWLEGPSFRAENADFTFALLFAKAVLAHLYLAWIHPYGDGNGRTARLIEFRILAESELVPLPACHLLSNHYNKTRSQYYRELDRASQSGGDVTSILQYAIQGFVDGLREQLKVVQHQQIESAWENLVHQGFAKLSGPANSRRKHLVLDMPPRRWVERSALRRVSSRIAEEYAGLTDKTLTRDLNFLVEMKLLERMARGTLYRANRGLIRAFMPPRAR
jgi:Fic family protein